jgi:hypothetical protein
MNKIPKIISASIDLSKIDQSKVVEGRNGAKYVDVTLVNTPGNQYGKDYLVKQDFGKEAREQRVETPILGNAKAFLLDQGEPCGASSAPSSPPPPPTPQVGKTSLDDLPF